MFPCNTFFFFCNFCNLFSKLPLHVFHLQRLSRCICNGSSVAIATEMPLQMLNAPFYQWNWISTVFLFPGHIYSPLNPNGKTRRPFPSSLLPGLISSFPSSLLHGVISSFPSSLFSLIFRFGYLHSLKPEDLLSLSLSLSPSRFSKISHQLRAPPHRDPPLCTRNPAATPPWNNEGTVTISNFCSDFLFIFLVSKLV